MSGKAGGLAALVLAPDDGHDAKLEQVHKLARAFGVVLDDAKASSALSALEALADLREDDGPPPGDDDGSDQDEGD